MILDDGSVTIREDRAARGRRRPHATSSSNEAQRRRHRRLLLRGRSCGGRGECGPRRLRAMTGGSWARSAAIHRSATSPASVFEHGRLQSRAGEGPPAHHRPPPRHLRAQRRHPALRPQPGHPLQQRPRPALQPLQRRSNHAQDGNPLHRTARIPVQGQGRLEPGQRDLVAAERPAKRVRLRPGHPGARPGENPRLRPAEQLVTGEKATRSTPAGDARTRRGLLRQPQFGAVEQKPRSQVVNDGDSGLGPERHQFVEPRVLGEPGHREVRAVHLEDRAHPAGRDGPRIIGAARPVSWSRPLPGARPPPPPLRESGSRRRSRRARRATPRPPSPRRTPSARAPPPPRNC